MIVVYFLLDIGYACPDLLSACCMCDCSSLKCQHCVQKYCCCCCMALFDSNSKMYPHIEYGRIQSHSEDKDSEDNNYLSNAKSVASVPCQKIFQYSQLHRQHSIHPQLDSRDGQIVLQQPYMKGYSEQSDTASIAGISNFPHEEMTPMIGSMSLEHSSYGGSMDDIGAEIGYVDMAKSSRYVDSNLSTPLFAQHQLESHLVPTIAQPRSASPFPGILDAGTELRKRSLPLAFPNPENPCIQFSLYYHENNRKLIVHLKQVSHVPTSRPEESSNPFTEVYLLPVKNIVHKSHVEIKTHNPIFDETFKFTELDSHDVLKQTLVMRIYINDRSHFVGGILYPLELATMNGDLIEVPISKFDEEGSLRVRHYFQYDKYFSERPSH